MKKVYILFFLISLVELIPHNLQLLSTALANEGNRLQYIITRLTIGNQAIAKNMKINESKTLQNKLFNVIQHSFKHDVFRVLFFWERKSYIKERQIAFTNDREIKVKRLSCYITEEKIVSSKFGKVEGSNGTKELF